MQEFKNINIDEFEKISKYNNSIIIDDFSWQEECSWEACGLDEINNIIDCYAQHNFNINALPLNYPGDVNVITYDDALSTPGITIIDYESLNFSVALDINGQPIWFADRNLFGNFNRKNLTLIHNQPINQNISLRWALAKNEEDGFIYNHFFKKHTNNRDELMSNLKLS